MNFVARIQAEYKHTIVQILWPKSLRAKYSKILLKGRSWHSLRSFVAIDNPVTDLKVSSLCSKLKIQILN